MKRMKAPDVYNHYIAIKTHFNNETYNALKYHFKVNHSLHTYKKRKDKHFFEKIAAKLQTKDIIPFFISQFIDGQGTYVADMADNLAESMQVYYGWKARIQALEYHYEQDLSHINSFLIKNDLTILDLFDIVQGKHPIIFRFLIENMIMLETYVILNRFYNFHERFEQQLQDPVWRNWELKLSKYDLLMPPTTEKMKEVTERYFYHA